MSATATERETPTSENCRFCWMCRHVCPVGRATSRETLTPHAWALTIESVRRGQLAWNAETAAVMYACADCGLCRTHCVTDQPLPDAIVAARAEIVRSGIAPDAVATYQQQFQTTLGRDAGPFEKAGRILFEGGGSGPREAHERAAALRLLEAAGMPAAPAGEARPTGLIASSLGLLDLATRAARDLVAGVMASGATEILVLGPADKWTFEYVYPKRLGVAWPEHVAVTEVTVALARALEEGRLRFRRRDSTPLAYHDPCHSPRVGRDATAPRRLIAAAYGDRCSRELFWRADRAHPCGAIGGLEMTHPDIARRLALARLEHAEAAGAELFVTDDPVCLAHLSAHASRQLKVAGLFGRLDECL